MSYNLEKTGVKKQTQNEQIAGVEAPPSVHSAINPPEDWMWKQDFTYLTFFSMFLLLGTDSYHTVFIPLFTFCVCVCDRVLERLRHGAYVWLRVLLCDLGFPYMEKLNSSLAFFLRKLKRCILRTLRGTSRCRTSW